MEKTKILIGEHNPDDLKLFEVMLGTLGFTVSIADDGEKILEQVRKFNPDVIIIESNMPIISGWKVTELLKENKEYEDYKDIPIIMLSENNNFRDKVAGIEIGLEDYITKPFNFYEIYARVRSVVKNRVLSKHIVEKEKKLATVESLNESLTYFTEHIKKPTLEIQKLANTIDLNNKEDVLTFVERVKDENGIVLAAIDGLAEEVEEIKRRGEEEFSLAFLRELEEKFKKRYKIIKDEGLAEKSIT